MRGPGVRRKYEDEGDDFELDMDQRTRALGGRSGRIILLGDGNNELSADSDDHEMIDDDDHDLEAQAGHDISSSFEDLNDSARGEREGTPGPEVVKNDASPQLSRETAHSENSATEPISGRAGSPKEPTKAENPETIVKAASDGAASAANADAKMEDQPTSAS